MGCHVPKVESSCLGNWQPAFRRVIASVFLLAMIPDCVTDRVEAYIVEAYIEDSAGPGGRHTAAGGRRGTRGVD